MRGQQPAEHRAGGPVTHEAARDDLRGTARVVRQSGRDARSAQAPWRGPRQGVHAVGRDVTRPAVAQPSPSRRGVAGGLSGGVLGRVRHDHPGRQGARAGDRSCARGSRPAVGDRARRATRNGTGLARHVAALGERLRPVRARRCRALQRPLQAARRRIQPSQGGLLVDLERAELRLEPVAAGNRPLHRRGLPCALPQAARRRLERAAGNGAPARHGPDRRDRAAGADGRRRARQLLGDGAVAVHPGAVLRRRVAASVDRRRRRRAKLPVDQRRVSSVPAGASGTVPGRRVRLPPISAAVRAECADGAGRARRRLRRSAATAQAGGDLGRGNGRVRFEHPPSPVRHRIRLPDQSAGDHLACGQPRSGGHVGEPG